MEQDLALLNGGSGKLSEFMQKPSNQILQVQTTAKFEDNNNNKNNFDETRELHGEHNAGNVNNFNQ